jgi:hypothetical protein
LTVPNSNGHQRRLPTKQHKTLEFPPTSGGNQGPCRDAGVGAIAPGFAMLKKASALHTLIHQRHPTPSCGGHAPTAERTLNPARTFLESLDRRPGIREQPGSKASFRSGADHFRSSLTNGRFWLPLECLKRATSRQDAFGKRKAKYCAELASASLRYVSFARRFRNVCSRSSYRGRSSASRTLSHATTSTGIALFKPRSQSSTYTVNF